MSRPGLRTKIIAACLGVVMAAGPVVISSSGAHGDPIADKQKQAQEIATKLDTLQRQVETASNNYEAAQERIAELDGQIKDQQAKVDLAEKQQAQDKSQLSKYAVGAYVSGGSTDALTTLVSTRTDRLGPRQGYNQAAMGNRQQLIDNLQASQKKAQDQVEKLNASRKEASEQRAKAAQDKQTAEQSTNKYEALRQQVQGQLAELVRQKQEAEQRAAEARAYAEAQARARAAQAQAEAQANAARANAARANAARASASAPPQTSAHHSTSGGSHTAAPARSAAVATPAPAAIPAPPRSSGGGYSAPAPAPSSGGGGTAVSAARSQLGVPYSWGAESPGSGFDCSGLTQWAWSQAGVSIPRTTYGQLSAGRQVPISDIQPGDLVFYYNTGHVAMYVGGGTVIHAPHTGDVVKYSSLYMSSPEAVVRP